MAADPLYEALMIDTRPVLEIDGDQYSMVSELIESLEVCEQEGGLSALEVVLGNAADHEGAGLEYAFEFTETNLFALGAMVRVLTGDAREPTEIFRGTVSAVSLEVEDGGQPKIRVMAEDALMAWRMVRRNRSFPAGKVRDIVGKLAADTPLTPVITGLNDEVDAQQQLNETDLGFLRRILARYDADAQVVGKELHVSPRAAVDRGKVTLELGDQLQSIRVTADLAEQRAATQLAGFDVLAGQLATVKAVEDQLGPGDGMKGSEAVEDAFPGSLDRLAVTSFMDKKEAKAIADTAQRRRARRFIIAEGVATGNSAIRIGTKLTLAGLGPRFSNDYYTTRTRHLFDQEGGYVTEFSAESGFLGRV
jgi:phage protein D